MFNHFLTLCKNIKSYNVNRILKKAVLKKKLISFFRQHEKQKENRNPVNGKSC